MAQQSQQPQGLIPWGGRFPKLKASGLFPLFFEDAFGDITDFGTEQTGLTVSEDKNNIYVEAALPGLQSKDIDVTLEKGVLWVKGEKKEEEQDAEKKYYRRAASSFSYRLNLPGQIDETKEPKAVFQDGVMKITFNKAKASQAKKIQVK